MAFQRLSKASWHSYCERVSRGIEGGQRAQFSVASLDLGERVAAKWMPLYGLVYEPKTDQVEIALMGVDHLVAHPKEILVETSPRGVVGIEILDADGVRQLVQFLEPLVLPPGRRRRVAA
jgi:hypothetical protein